MWIRERRKREKSLEMDPEAMDFLPKSKSKVQSQDNEGPLLLPGQKDYISPWGSITALH